MNKGLPPSGLLTAAGEKLFLRMEKRILNGEKEDVVQKDLLEEDCFYRWYDSLIKEMAGMTNGEKN